MQVKYEHSVFKFQLEHIAQENYKVLYTMQVSTNVLFLNTYLCRSVRHKEV